MIEWEKVPIGLLNEKFTIVGAAIEAVNPT